MTILSELVKQAASVADVQSRLNRHGALVRNLTRRRTIIGAGIGAVAGGAGVGAAQYRANKGKDKRRHGSVSGAAVRGALTGVLFGSQLGAASGLVRGLKSQNRAHRYADSWIRRRMSSSGPRSAPRSGAGSNPFWGGIRDEKIRRQAQGVAAHAKKTTGPEGQNARNILSRMGRKHGFDPDTAIKHAAFAAEMRQALL